MDEIFASGHPREYPKGQILLYQGSGTYDTFHIKSGFVKVYDITSEGEEKILLILGPGDVLPIIWSYRGDYLHYFYAALTDVELTTLPYNTFIKVSDKKHEYTLELLRYVVDRTQELMKRLESIDSTSSEKKILLTLDYLGTVHGKVNGRSIVLPEFITHELVANMTGLSRETASLIIKELENIKLLTQRPKFKINKKKLADKIEG